MPIIEGARRRGGRLRAHYDFAVLGGAIGAITLVGDLIPSGATIVGGYIEVTTPPTSGGAATISVGTEGAADLQAAAVVSGAPWSTTGRKSVVPAFTGASSIRTTAGRQVTITVATATLTAGVFDVVVFYEDV